MKSLTLIFAIAVCIVCALGATEQDDNDAACDPLVPHSCLLPFPNDYWTTKSRFWESDTGRRLFFPPNVFPADRQGERIDPKIGGWNSLDGFSPIAPILSYFEDVSLEGVPGHQNIEPSLAPDCPTVLLDTSTGERVAHWAEVDESGNDDSDRLFMLWPAQRLKASTRYIVAFRNLLSQSSGLPVQSSPAFAALRDDTPSSLPGVEARRPHFEEIFSELEEIGVSRSSLQLAWDFTVSSRNNNTAQLVTMRDDALSRIPTGGPQYFITDIEEDPSSQSRRKVHGDMLVPLYMTNARPGATLVLDGNNLPVFQGFTNVSFTVQISNKVVEDGQPGMVVQYGHGLFGSQKEVSSGWLQTQADTYGWVLGAVNWWGMSAPDVPAVSLMLAGNLTDFKIIPDRCQQGLVNQLVFSRLLMSEAFQQDPAVTVDGVRTMSNKELYYWGNSQGGILGSVLMAATQDIHKGVLGVPGGPYSQMLFRSVDFEPYFDVLSFRFRSSADQLIILNAFQLLWDRSEPSGYMDAITANTLPNTPEHQVILHYALSDAQVSWLSCLTLSRSMDAVVFPNNVEEQGETLYGFPVSQQPVTKGAVMQGWYYGTPPAPQTDVPPSEEYDTHSCPRKDPRAQDQIDLFFQSGVVVDFCDGKGCGPIDLSGCVFS